MARSRRLSMVLIVVLSIGSATAVVARAQGQGGAEPASKAARVGAAAKKPEARKGPAVGRRSILQLVVHANPMLWPLVLCSVVTLGFALERLVALRRSRVIPRDFVQRFTERLAAGKLDRDRAAELCRAHDSPVARIFAHAVRYWGQPAVAIRQAIDADAAVEVLDLRRNVRVLNATATLAPLLGLLGTVVGMIEAFDALGVAGGSKSEQLAHGISLALVTTAFGLGIAVVSVAAYYYLLNRVDLLVRDLDAQVGRVVELVADDGVRVVPERRAGMSAGEPSRHEPRTLGRSDPVRVD